MAPDPTLEKARAEYIDAVKNTERRKHSFTVRARQSHVARAKAIAFPTKANRKAYRKAKATRALRLRAYRRARERRNILKVKYERLKKLANQPMRRRALAEALRDVGITESGGNNRGPGVERIIAEGGGHPGEAWCLWGVISWYKAAGSKANWSATWGGVRNIKIVDGVKRVLIPLAGHIIEYTFEHTGLFICWCNADGKRRPRIFATHLKAVEANTGDSGATSDSQTGGDGVKVKIRPRSLVRAFYKSTK